MNTRGAGSQRAAARTRGARRPGHARQRDRSIPTSNSTNWPVSRARPAPRSCCARSQERRAAPIRPRSSAAARPSCSRAPCDEADVDSHHRRQRPDAGAGAQSREGLRPARDRSHRADSRHLRAARADARRAAAGRAGAAAVPAAAAGRIERRRCRGSAAASARADPVKRSSRPIAGASGTASAVLKADIARGRQAPRLSARAAASAPTCRPSRWSATRTPARRRCSTC